MPQIQTIASAANLNSLAASDRAVKVVIVNLAASDATTAGVLSWQNPEPTAVLVGPLLIDVTTASSGACTVDFGTAATPVLNDTMIDGVSVASTGVKNSEKHAGTNGVSFVKVPVSEYVTGTVASGASSGLVGKAYIYYVPI